ncbi:hypothetical protein NUACC21_24810 [Scytonema sp. NUACC21]
MKDIHQRIAALSPEQREILKLRLKQQSVKTKNLTSIPKRIDSDVLCLSLSQERFWLLHQLQPNLPLCNEFSLIRFIGKINANFLEKSINEIIKRHEILRTSFQFIDSQLIQHIHPQLTVKLPIIDIQELSKDEQEATAKQLITEFSIQTFDLTLVPLLRVALIRLHEQEHILLSTIHHIIYDGWSRQIFYQELTTLYEAFCKGKLLPLPELPIQYADFALWQRQSLDREDNVRQLAYWKKQLRDIPPILALPTDCPRPIHQSYRGGRANVTIPQPLTDALKSLGQKENATLFMVLLAVFKTLLYRYTGQTDLLVGTPVANRTRTETENLIGCFLNTLVLRTKLSHELSFRELLARVKETTLEAYDHQELPFEQLVKELQPERALSYTPLFQVMFVFQEAPLQALQLPNLTLNPQSVDVGIAKFDLTLYLEDTKQGLEGALEYNTDLFNTTTINRVIGHFTHLLEGIVNYPEKRLSNLPLLTVAEEQALLVKWNDTTTNDSKDKCIHQLFEAQVESTPDAIAVVFEDQQLSYSELNAKANQLAYYLQSLGVKPETLVGICVERSLYMVIGLLGVLKAGGAYVPLDPHYPQERLAFMLSDSQVSLVISHSSFVNRFRQMAHNKGQITVISLDRDWEIIKQESKDNPISISKVDNLAYVIYTSGSTGQPKGVLGLHRGAINRFQWMWQNYPFRQDEIGCQKTSLNFVDSVWEIFGPLLQGVSTVIVTDQVVKDPQQFVKALAHNNVTRIVLVPSLLRVLLNTYNNLQLQLPKLKLWISSGEALSTDVITQFQKSLPDSILLNLYGSSEVSADVTCHSMSSQTPVPPSVLIGRSIANTQIYILDASKRPVPVGVPGEIYVGGDQLARGYLNRPGLTAEKFIPNPFSNKLGARLYKTGDLARYMPNGDVEYLGRIDHQVKIRGFRIELGEIEAALCQHLAVRETAVILQFSETDSQSLVAYVVPYPGETLTITELRQFLESKLPNYMIPAAFVLLEALPLTPNGKIDRKALPTLDSTQLLSESDFIAASTPIEQILVGIWKEVLGIENIGIRHNFFTLGGHSLLGTRVFSQLRQVFQIELPLQSLFEQPTIAGLAKEIEKATHAGLGLEVPPIKRIERSQELPLSFAQQRLWFLAQLEPNSPFYNISAAVRLQGQLNVKALQLSFNEIVRRHEALRTNFKTIEGQAVAVISEATSLVLPILNLSELASNQQEVEVKQQALQEAQQPFNLEDDLLLRVKLLHLSEQEHIVLLTMHHIAADGWSMGVLVRELAALYQAFCNEQPSPLAELPIQYVDFASWQRQWLTGEALQSHISYWLKQLEDAPRVLELPTDRPRPAVQTFRGGTYSFELSDELSLALNKLSQQHGSTLFMTLLAGFVALLRHYTGSEDIVVGSPIANRNRGEIEGLIGFFINTLVLRTNLAGNPTFEALLTRVREMTLAAYAHQDLPFDVLVEQLQPQRDLSRSPLFQVMFVLQNAPMSALELQGLTLTSLESNSDTAKFDLTLYMQETASGIIGTLEYNVDLFEAQTIKRMAGHLQTLLAEIVAHPQQPLSELSLLTQAEKNLLVEWNDTQADYPQLCIHELFEAQVERTPEAVAVLFEEEKLTYRELNERANQLAHYLRYLGVKPETLVGICVERSLHMVIGLLAILKAGGAYVPLDPTYPPQRLAYILEDAQVPVLLTQASLVQAMPQHKAKVVCLDTDGQAIVQHSQENLLCELTAQNLAYVIYTSGSTGKPKGVQIPHSALSNFLSAMKQTPGLTHEDTLLAITTYAFDIAALELFLPIIVGACLVVVSREVALDGMRLSSVLTHSKATVMQATPATWQMLLATGWNGNHHLKILCGGEALPGHLASQLMHRCHSLWNMYGPTETTIWSAASQVVTQSNVVPISHPIANTQLYILNQYGQLVPVGVPGELHIGGAGLARGYFHRPDLTAEKFIPNPLRNEPGALLYKTGDLARYLPSGEIEYIGRIDHQVKIRGLNPTYVHPSYFISASTQPTRNNPQ